MRYFFYGILFIYLIGNIYGQSVRATVETSEVYLGQPFEYRIIIEGITGTQTPVLDPVDGIRIQYKGVSTSMVSSFGLGSNNSTKTVTHSWSFTPLRKGTLIIPSFTIPIDGKEFKTASGSIIVKNPEPIEGFELIIETEKDEYWYGEPINVSIKWLVSSELLTKSKVSYKSMNIPFINSGQFTVENQNPPPGSNVSKLNINNLEVLAMQSAEIFKGKQYSAISFSLKLIPQNSGQQNLGPITLLFDSYQSSIGYTTLVIPSNQLSLKIQDLPELAYEKGKPILLSKGKLSLEATAMPLKVHIGDPLTYTIQVKGAVSPEKLELPLLSSFEVMKNSFSIPERRSPGKVEEDIVSFSQTIRVKNNDVKKIPEINIKYFNLESGSIEVATVESIDLEVLETEIITSANLESTGYTSSDRIEKFDLVPNDEGLAVNFPINKLLKRSGGSQKYIFESPLYWILFLLPIITFLIFFLISKKDYILFLYNRIRGEKSAFTIKYHEIISNNVFEFKQIKFEIYHFLLSYCESNGKELTTGEIFNKLLMKQNDLEISLRIKDILNVFDEIDFSPAKKEIDCKAIFKEFYSITGELK